MVTGSQLFPYFTFVHTATFILLSSFHSHRQIFARDFCSFLSSRGVMIVRKSKTNFSPTTADQNLIFTNATLMTAPVLLHPAEKNSYLLPQSVFFLLALKYTWQISENSLSFLAFKLSINHNCLSTTVHYKRTNAHNYLLHWSFHPHHVKNATPFSQFLILRRLYSDDSDFNNKCDEMCQFFQKARLPWLHCNHGQIPSPRNRPRDRTTNFTERRNQQNSIHPYLPSTKPCSQGCHSQ